MLRCHGDDGIGPVLEPALFLSGCYDFDFTLVFEDVLFSILPCGVFLLLAAWRVAVLRARPVLVRWPLLRASKQVRVETHSSQVASQDYLLTRVYRWPLPFRPCSSWPS